MMVVAVKTTMPTKVSIVHSQGSAIDRQSSLFTVIQPTEIFLHIVIKGALSKERGNTLARRRFNSFALR